VRHLPEEERRRVGAYYELGFGFAGAIGLFGVVGWLLDGKLDTTPILTVIGLAFGAVAGFYFLISRAFEIQRWRGDGDKSNNGSSEPSTKAPDVKD
jgi:F0F1-type ATP synthase assembly protein I